MTVIYYGKGPYKTGCLLMVRPWMTEDIATVLECAKRFGSSIGAEVRP